MIEDKPSPLPDDLARLVYADSGVVYTVAELRGRATVLEPRVVVWQEIARGTPETLGIIGGRVEELSRRFDRYAVLIDLADAHEGATTAAYRKTIPQFFNGLNARSAGRLRLVAVAFQGNLVARTVANFVVARMVDMPWSVHKNRALALEAARRALE